MDIDQYRKNSEDFISKLEKEYYLHFSGIKEDVNFSAIYDEYDFLFSLDNVEYLKTLKETSSGEQRKKTSYLLKFCVEGYLQGKVKSLFDQICADEANAKVEVDGKEVSYRYSEVILSNEANKEKRDLIDDRRNEIVEKLFNRNLVRYWEELHLQAENLGFSSYVELFSYLKDEDFLRLKEDMEMLLEATQDMYEEHFGSFLEKELGIKLEDSRRSDFSFLRRAKKYDSFFKKGCLIDLFRETLLGMGIDLGKQPNIHLDIEEREKKSPRAFCSTVKVPQEIYLVVMPIGGQDDYEAMFHEGGHAEHFGCTSPRLDFEYRYLGDNALTEGYAFCFEHLMQDRSWLVDVVGFDPDDAKGFIYFSNIVKLWFLRRYAAKLKYELILHSEKEVFGKEGAYQEILSQANLMKYPWETYLKDVDEGFYCTNYLRAWIFEAQLKNYILEEFDYTWYKKKKTGDFLRELWSYGQKYTPEELLREIGFKGLQIEYLINSLAFKK
ncbi:MAG: hypothetical protein H5T85_00780 [Actinobacteria bacterium]|nr:hypothetical protein [Actinomycetota bacterium]